MTAEEIRMIVRDEETERLTALFCHQWTVAAERMEGLEKEFAEGFLMDVEAELYTIVTRLKDTLTALMELNWRPAAFLFAENLGRMAAVVGEKPICQSVIALFTSFYWQDDKPAKPFFDCIENALNEFFSMPDEQQEKAASQASALEQLMPMLLQSLKPEDLMSLLPLIQEIHSEPAVDEDETREHMSDIRQAIDTIGTDLASASLQIVILLLLLGMLPDFLLRQMMAWRTDSRKMAPLLNKVLAQVRQSEAWDHYWEGRRKTMRVVSDSASWNDTLRRELQREKECLAQVPEGLFAKWTDDAEAFAEDFLKAGLDDNGLRSLIFHLACSQELARELNPFAKDDKEEMVRNDAHTLAEAVLADADKLYDLVAERWSAHYLGLWQDLLKEKNILDRLKVTRRSPHNNLYTARFFCHLVGEMKKSAVFGNHSDMDLAKKLADKHSQDTFRKNIQEGIMENEAKEKEIFKSKLLKYSRLIEEQK